MFLNPFSFQGRVNRLEYGISVLISILFFYLSQIISTSNILQIHANIYYIPTFWFLIAQGTKREHDLGYSGWVQFVPFRIFWLVFSEGEPYPNQYGESLNISKEE